MTDPIRVRFDEIGSSTYFFELYMPFPVHAGDRVDYDGYSWEIDYVTWVITEDSEGVPIFMLKAAIR